MGYVTVSLCVREWIETADWKNMRGAVIVSLCVREWIETVNRVSKAVGDRRLPLREGVD